MPINLGKLESRKKDIMQKLKDGIQQNNGEAMSAAMEEWSEVVSECVLAEAKGIVGAADSQILAARGCRQLTSKENEYYGKLISACKSSNPKQAVENIDVAFPETVIDSVMEDIESKYELLNAIDLRNTTLLTKWIVNKQGKQKAVWGEINSKIEEELKASIDIISLNMYKLSAFMYIEEDMLDLGPVWVDRYVRAILVDALACGAEDGVINGDGKTTPIGMIRDVSESAAVVDGKYPEKTATKVTNFDPQTYGGLLATLAKSPTGKVRAVTDVILVVNPFDYFKLVMPATTLQLANGTYANNVLPYPTKIIQSTEVAEGKAILGMGKRYFLGVGTGKNGKLESSDQFRFLDDQRTYKIKLHASGKPIDNNAFLLLDISGLEPLAYNVKTTTATAASE
jgi:HK97 family phage major capsid protein